MGFERMANQAIKETGGTPPQSTVLDFLTKYIPGELIAFYIPVVAALPSFEKLITGFDKNVAGIYVYCGFVIGSPLIFLFIYMTKASREELVRLRNPLRWPLFRMGASLIAFALWALAVPGNPILKSTAGDETNALGALIAGVLAPIVSWFLSGVELIVSKIRGSPS